MKASRLLLCTLITLLPLAASAEKIIVAKSADYQTAVVELYTSEGCSSCPPADRWLAQLVEIPKSELDVLALAFHVDYWDYIGWKDEFADPRYTERQRRLASINNQRSIYTPEFFVDGEEARGTGNILQRIKQANATRSPVDLQLSVTSQPGQFKLRLEAAGRQASKDMQVQFVVFEDALGNQVDRGENAGEYLSHQRVVRYLSQPIRLSDGELKHQVVLPSAWKTDNLGVAALVTSGEQQYLQSVYTLLD